MGDAVLLRQKFLLEADDASWIMSPGLVIDCLEEASGYLMFEVMFETEVGWWDDYELKLITEYIENKDKITRGE